MYEENPGTVTNALENSSSAVFDPALVASILELTVSGTGDQVTVGEALSPSATGAINIPAGVELAFVTPGAENDLTTTSDVKVLILQGTSGVNLTVNAGLDQTPSPQGQTDRVIVGTAGADLIVISDNRNSEIVAGDGDTVRAGSGHDTIFAAQGDSTIRGGTGNDIVRMSGNEENYSVRVVGGRAVVERDDGNQTLDISRIQFVQLQNGDALIFAKDAKEAAVSMLYQAAYGRTADAGGLDYWFDQINAGARLEDIARAFTTVSEFDATEALSNTAFINQLYVNTFGRTAEAAGMAYWLNTLQVGATRAELIASFSNIASHHIDGTQTVNVEAVVVGSVTLVAGILG